MIESYNNFIKAFTGFINECKPFLFWMFIFGLIVFVIELCCRYFIYGLTLDQVIYCIRYGLNFKDFSEGKYK